MEERRVEKQLINQNVIIENRERMSISGVIDIHSFDDEVVLVETELGILTIKGEDLRLNKLNLENNELIIEGNIIAMAYSQKSETKAKGFMNKLFK